MKTWWYFHNNYTLTGFAFSELLHNINKMPYVRYIRDTKMDAVSVLYNLQYEVAKYRSWKQKL